jgi:hypothetical protein
MAKNPPKNHQSWTPSQNRDLRHLATQNTPTRVIGIKLERSPAAVYSQASKLGVSLKPTNQSPYNRRKQ